MGTAVSAAGNVSGRRVSPSFASSGRTQSDYGTSVCTSVLAPTRAPGRVLPRHPPANRQQLSSSLADPHRLRTRRPPSVSPQPAATALGLHAASSTSDIAVPASSRASALAMPAALCSCSDYRGMPRSPCASRGGSPCRCAAHSAIVAPCDGCSIDGKTRWPTCFGRGGTHTGLAARPHPHYEPV